MDKQSVLDEHGLEHLMHHYGVKEKDHEHSDFDEDDDHARR